MLWPTKICIKLPAHSVWRIYRAVSSWKRYTRYFSFKLYFNYLNSNDVREDFKSEKDYTVETLPINIFNATMEKYWIRELTMFMTEEITVFLEFEWIFWYKKWKFEIDENKKLYNIHVHLWDLKYESSFFKCVSAINSIIFHLDKNYQHKIEKKIR